MIIFTAVAAVPRPPRQHADARPARDTAGLLADVAPLPGPLSPDGAASAFFTGQRLEHPSKGPAGETCGATHGVVAPLFDRRLDVALAELRNAPVQCFTWNDWPGLEELIDAR